ISNTGVLGAALMGIFLILTFCRRPALRTPLSTELMAGLKLSLVPALVMIGVSAPGPDFGPWIAVVFGAAAGLAAFRPTRRSVDAAPDIHRKPAPVRSRRSLGNRAFGARALPSPSPRSGGPDKPAPRPSF